MPAKKSVVQKSSTVEPQLVQTVEPKEVSVVQASKKLVKKSNDVPVVQTETPVVNVVQEGGKKNLKKSQDSKSAKPVEVKSEAKPKRKAKSSVSSDKPKPVAKKVVKKAKSQQEGGEDAEEVEGIDKLIRSFKVKLPNKEEFEGRFTGLTPYQAANKALSKYFREVDNPDGEVTFCIVESTRKSKKTVYTYVGKRYKLEVPVVYKIQDGREIVKNFKNSLKKVKKADLNQ